MNKTKPVSERVQRLGTKRDEVGTKLRMRAKREFEAVMENFRLLISNYQNPERNPMVKDSDGPTAFTNKRALPLGSTTGRSQYAMEVTANSIVVACESLLAVAADLKRLLAINDHEALTAYLDARGPELDMAADATWSGIKQLRDDLGEHLYELEEACAD